MAPSLTDIIRTQIRAQGTISLAEYMSLCLTHPQFGYYTTRDPLGAEGDFTTSPEMTQVFGELIGLWCAQVWQNLGKPAKFTLCELGAGRGTLMLDALRAAKNVAGFVEAAEIYLLDASPVLKAKQAATLAAYQPRWISSLTELPDQPTITLANEFFDALPVRQFQKVNDEWKERRIGLSNNNTLAFVLTPTVEAPNFDAEDGTIVEICPDGVEFASAIARPILKNRGAALIIDYGDDEVIGETLQAVSNHRQAHLFSTAGTADITAHVSFAPLMTAARKIGCRVYPTLAQGEFLLGLGAKERTEQLCANAREDQKRSLQAALHRLTDKQQMGTLFKVLVFTDRNSPTPPAI